MNLRTCSPRPVRYAVFASLVLLVSTFLFGHDPAVSDTDPVAAAQWRTGAQQVQLQGQIEIVHQDFPDGHGQYVYTLRQSDGTRMPMYFVKTPPKHLLTGDHVTVTGQQSSSGLILYSGSNAQKTGGGSGGSGSGSCTADSGQTCTSTSSIPVPNTFGTQQTLVILVNFQDDVGSPYAINEVQNAFFNTANSFIQENSYGQTSLAGDVVGWYTIPDSYTTCNISQIGSDAQTAAAAAGVNLSSYTRFVYFFVYDAACGFSGASQVGGNPSQTWINSTLNPYVIHHELGHALGLWHAHLFDCGTSATICSNPNIVEYGDSMDVMGVAQAASPDYNAFQKERLGWLGYGASPSIQTITSSGSYTIYPYEQMGAGPKALKVLKSTDPTSGAKTWYYLEARQATGFDAFLTSVNTQNEATGVLFHLGTDGNGGSSDLLDMTPATPTSTGWADMSLAVGQSFQDSTAGVTFAPAAVNSSGATVQITLNGSSCSSANPMVSISPSQSQSVSPGTPVTFTVTVTDNDSSSCAPATFNLSGTMPSGWSGMLSSAALSLSPGKSGSATLSLTSPAGTADGSYNVTATATNAAASSDTGSATAVYVINSAPLSVSLATNQPSYLPGQTVGVNVTMLYGTVPDVGANVTVTVISPKGRATTLTGTTGSNGVASLSYKLGRNAPAGTYTVQYGTSVAGAASAMGASTSFTVQ